MRIAINGFGRIGRVFLRSIISNPEIQVVAINDHSPIPKRLRICSNTIPYTVTFKGKVDFDAE